MGLHPYLVPVGVNTEPYNGLPATTYSAWSNGFGPFFDDKWHPGLTSVPEALATGNFELRTHCRVVRILTDKDGRARGVKYVDAGGELRVQKARIVILCSYTYENVGSLSGDTKHADGLGNNAGQVGKHYMTKMFAHVNGFFSGIVFNRHTGRAAQGVVLDDLLSVEYFDSYAHGFIGGVRSAPRTTVGAYMSIRPSGNCVRIASPPGNPLVLPDQRSHSRRRGGCLVLGAGADKQPTGSRGYWRRPAC